MKRVRINIEDVASCPNILEAAYKASRCKREKAEVKRFFRSHGVEKLQDAIIRGDLKLDSYKSFVIFDPKERIINYVPFPLRVFHHALMNVMAPVLEKSMIYSSFACRKGKGSLAAVKYVQKCAARNPWYVKIDIRKYFDSIDHRVLFRKLDSKFKGPEFMNLLYGIINSYHKTPGTGLPIGSLTSQYFANYYLDGIDRFIQEELKVPAYTRYMDDMIWWCKDRKSAKETLSVVVNELESPYCLTVKDNRQINRSLNGVTFCGFRVFPYRLLLTRRRKRRYLQGKRKWESLYEDKEIDGLKLQNGYDSVYSIVQNAESREWRKQVRLWFAEPDV